MLLISFVPVDKITSKISRSNFSEDKLNRAAELILRAKGSIKPLVLQEKTYESYEIVDGDFEYYAAVRAKEMNPQQSEMIGAFILDSNNEEVIQEQVVVFRPKSHIITLEEKIDTLVSKVTQLEERTTIKGIENNLNKQLAIIRQETNNLPQEKALSILTETQNNLNEQREYIRQEIKKLEQVNLLTVNRDALTLLLEGVNSRIASAAWSAIEYWRQQGRTMTWDNLKSSTRGGSEHKIPNFGESTYRKLKEIGCIKS